MLYGHVINGIKPIPGYEARVGSPEPEILFRDGF